MASTPTEAAPAPIDPAALQRVPGVLGRIARERAEDYERTGTPSAPPADAARRVGRLRDALARPGLSVVAEIKRGSPSAGALADLDPLGAARAYRRGGAAALSVLTEPRHFGGQLAHLRTVAGQVDLPAMRKEFVVHPAQIAEAAEAGAAAVLLIAAVLGDRLAAYRAWAGAWGLDALVEVHDEAELDLALEAGTEILGVNNRDLRTLDVDLETAPRLLRRARDGGYAGRTVAESGYERGAQLRELRGVADGVLIGTALAGSGDLEAALMRLRAEMEDPT